MTKHNVKVYTHDVFLCGLVRGDQLIRPGSGHWAYDFMICPSVFQKKMHMFCKSLQFLCFPTLAYSGRCADAAEISLFGSGLAYSGLD